MIVVITGNGKGKTTACLGQMIRAVGDGRKAIMIQFIKGPWVSGEHKFVQEIKNNKDKMKIYRGGLGFVGILGDKIPFNEHKKAAQKTLLLADGMIKSNKWDVIILDEINVAVSLKLLTVGSVMGVIKNVKENKIVILSGRSASKSFIKKADLVSEIIDIKHPFYKGKKASMGFDF